MAKFKLVFFSLLFLLTFYQCQLNNDNKTKVLATAAGNKLTQTQMELSIPENLTGVDSISFAQNFIETWVKNQLLLEKAKENLDKKTIEKIDVMINNYQTSLLVYNYQQLLMQQNLDTIITNDQVDEYYNKNAGNFKLDSNAVKAIFIQLPKSSPDFNKVRQWIKSKNEEDIISLEDFCYQNARNFYMAENWLYLNQLLRLLPNKINNQEHFIKTGGYVESTDSLYTYFAQITDYKLINDTCPLPLVYNKISDIILNRRKTSFINDLKNNVYRDAVNQKKFKIYTN